MSELFLKILNMSLKASYVILAVIIIRFLLKKAPKKYSYALWLCAAFRLVCPVSFKSVISLFALKLERGNTTHVDLTQVVYPAVNNINPQANVGIPMADAVINNSLPAPTPQYSANPMQIIMYIAALVWLVGIAALLIYGVVSYIRLHRKLHFAVKFEDNVYQTEAVSSPFIMGFARPKIYIPYGLDSSSLEYVLAHERAHIKRLDHIVKPLAFLILAVHWFNPLVWLSFYLMSRDMEMSCDEKVLAKEDSSNTDYSATLLSLAVKGRFPSPSPLAFGESNVKKRIKNALKFKKPALWISIIAIIICIAVIFICAADPKENEKATADDIFKQVYSIPEVIYMDGKYSLMPVTDDTACYYIDENGTIFHKGWIEEAGWDELGTLENILLTKSNFDDYFDSGSMEWSEDYSVEKLRNENKAAWKFENSGNLYYVLHQKNGEIFYVVISNHAGTDDISIIGEGVSAEFCVRWIFRMQPVGNGDTEYAIAGDSYVSYQCLYMTPVSSFAAIGGDSGYRYLFVIDEELAYCKGLVRIDRSTGDIMSMESLDYGDWGVFPYTEEEWNEMFMGMPVDISKYTAREWMQLSGNYALALMDSSEMWFVQLGKHPDGNEYIWSIYSLVPEEYMGSATWNYTEGYYMKIDFDIPGNMSAVCTQRDISSNGINFDVGAEWSDGSIYWNPVNENGELVNNAQIHFSSDSGYAGVVYIVGSPTYIAGSATRYGMQYTVETSGTGLYIEQVDEKTARIIVKDDIFEFAPTREPLDFTVDNTGEDFFRYEDIEGRTMTSYKDYTNTNGIEYSFRSPAAASECAEIVVIGEIVDKHYVDGNTVNDLEGACIVYDLKISQSLRGDYVNGDVISVVCYGGYYRWYLQSPHRYEAATAGNPKYAGMGEVGVVIGYGGVPEMQIGEEYVMFLHGNKRASFVDGARMIVGYGTGAYKVNDDSTVSRYIDAEKIWTYGTVEELIEEVKENPFDEEKYYDLYIGRSFSD